MHRGYSYSHKFDIETKNFEVHSSAAMGPTFWNQGTPLVKKQVPIDSKMWQIFLALNQALFQSPHLINWTRTHDFRADMQVLRFWVLKYKSSGAFLYTYECAGKLYCRVSPLRGLLSLVAWGHVEGFGKWSSHNAHVHIVYTKSVILPNNHSHKHHDHTIYY